MVAEHPLWYHTIEVAPAVITPGWFDLRPSVDRLPWPDVRDKRCLDVGTYDGFLAFELERRGAAEVVATDIPNHHEWDWSFAERTSGPELLDGMAAQQGEGFEIAKRLLGSRVERVPISAYDLSPETVGRFDVVVCGSLMLHLRDPVRALESIRSVCSEQFMSAETINLPLTALLRKTSVAALAGGESCRWLIPNSAGHRQLVVAAGFEIERTTRPYAISFGSAHPRPRGGPAARLERGLARLLTGSQGIAHAALLARPRDA